MKNPPYLFPDDFPSLINVRFDIIKTLYNNFKEKSTLALH